MAIPADHTEKNKTSPTTACPAWCIGHDADAPDRDNDYLHEATPALMPCITLERTTNETGTIHHHPTATELTLASIFRRLVEWVWVASLPVSWG